MISDVKLEGQFLESLADLSSYDMGEAKKFIEGKGLSEEDFAAQGNWLTYIGIAKCIQAGIPATTDNLRREILAIDPQANALALAGNVNSGKDHGLYLEGYYEKLVEISDRRASYRLIEDAMERVKEGKEPASAVKFRLANSLQRTRGRKQTKSLNHYVNEVMSHVDDVRNGKSKPVIPTYIKDLDLAIGGWQPTLTLVGAEPGVGKSALFVTGIDLQARNGHKPFVASLEDSPEFMAYRVISKHSTINQFDLRFTKLGHESYKKIQNSNKDADKYRENIRVVDGSEVGMRIEDLVSSANDAIINEGCDSVWIDHLGEIVLTNNERTDLEIARHLSLLRGIANRHGVPVIVAAHLKRPTDPLAPPSFRDFANSSGAERKARVALGLRRDPGSDTLCCHILKQTNGPAGGTVYLKFDGAAAMILEVEGGYK